MIFEIGSRWEGDVASYYNHVITWHPSRNPPTGSRSAGSSCGIVAIVALVGVGRQLGGSLQQFAGWVDGLGWWGPLIFMAGYIGATVAFVPGSVLTLVRGRDLRHWSTGTVYVFIAATDRCIGVGVPGGPLRGAGGDRGSDPRQPAVCRAIDRAVEREGLKIVLLLRLSPIFPFNLLNYALGLTGVRFTDYVIASIGMLPGKLCSTSIPGRWRATSRCWRAGPSVERGAAYYAVVALGLVATVVVTILVTRTARRALREAITE